ncbi:hypothetical protein ScPMuIL_002600 [Solemya velum]
MIDKLWQLPLTVIFFTIYCLQRPDQDTGNTDARRNGRRHKTGQDGRGGDIETGPAHVNNQMSEQSPPSLWTRLCFVPYTGHGASDLFTDESRVSPLNPPKRGHETLWEIVEETIQFENEYPEGWKQNVVVRFLKKNLLIVLMVTAIVIGVTLGIGLRDHWSPMEARNIHFLRFPGDLLMNMLKMLILPLIVSSLISSLAALDTHASGKLGVRAIVYYLTTTLAAVIIGIVLVLSIQPGNKGDGKFTRTGKEGWQPYRRLTRLDQNCFPPNLIAACFEKQVTQANTVNHTIPATQKNESVFNLTATLGNGNLTGNNTAMDTVITIESPKIVTADGMNILGLVVFSIFFGTISGRLGPEGRVIFQFFEALHIVTMKMVTLVIWYSPVGIIFLVAAKIVEMEDPAVVFQQLAYYFATVMLGLFVHGFLVLPLVYFVAVRRNPYRFLLNMTKAVLTAWGTASSSATLPITMECLETKNHIDARVTKFVAPIGATINMDGTALYEAVAAIFIAQVNNISLSIGQVIAVSITATAAAIGAAGVPQAGLVTMAIVLTAVGLPVEDVTLILSIDWFLDRFRTAINVIGDSYGAGIVYHLSMDDLLDMDSHEDGIELDAIQQEIVVDDVKQKTGDMKFECKIETVNISTAEKEANNIGEFTSNNDDAKLVHLHDNS